MAAFESRRADEMTRLIQRHGGVPMVSPAMREVAEEETDQLVDFAKSVMTGQIEIVVLLTGTGFQQLVQAVERQVDRDRFLASLADITLIARGPKPVAALREFGLTATHRVPEPNTWRELLATMDAEVPVSSQTVALQEYGQPNPSLIAGLEARGARVVCLKVYRWELPEDVAPLDRNVQALVRGEADMALFTSAQQLEHLLRRAAALGESDRLRQALDRLVVGSIGPTTSERLRAREWPVDFEPSHPRMGQLVAEAAGASAALLARKRRLVASLARVRSPAAEPEAAGQDSLFLRACRRQPNTVTPVWLMRQAGRYLPEYRAVRQKVGFLELCKRPDLCAEIMVTTVQRLGVDAAIIFSDLLPILEPMGMELEYAPGEGPVIHNPLRASPDIDRVMEIEDLATLDFVMETVRQTRRALPAEIPVIGFAGAPFTLASYMIEGGASRNYLHTKTLMFRDAGAWHELMRRLANSIARYLNAQIAAGAQCVQLFDSWAGCLGPDDYRHYVLPHVQSILAQLAEGVPVINFATGNPALLPLLAEAGPAVVGVDWRVRLDTAWEAIGAGFAVQGNLDPLVLLADRATVQARSRDILRMAEGRPGHIFNLGHGVLPQTPVDNVLALVDTIHHG